jgi:hypothetical protein
MGLFDTLTTGTLGQIGDPGDIFGGNPNSKFAKPQPPTPPDYKGLIDEQAKVNRIGQNTPWGSLSYTTDKNGNQIANYNLSPQYQSIANSFFKNMQGASNFQPAKLQTGFNRGIANNYFANAMKLLQPQLTQAQDQFTQNLADRGLPAGSQLYGSLSDQFNSNRNNLLTQTAQDAISQGLAYTQAQNQARQQQQQANQSYLTGMGQAYGQFTPGLNSFFSPSGIDVTGSASLAQSGAQNNYNALMQAYSGNMQGITGLLGSLGAAYIGAPSKSDPSKSDRRLKTDITRIGETDDGIPLYSFRYKGESTFRIGPMADEVRQRQPDAVFTGPDGYDRVFYGMLH